MLGSSSPINENTSMNFTIKANFMLLLWAIEKFDDDQLLIINNFHRFYRSFSRLSKPSKTNYNHAMRVESPI